MGKKRPKRYQAIGGPVCGSRIPTDQGPLIGVTNDETGEQHWYWLIRVYDSDAKSAKYWHYIGEDPEDLDVLDGPRYFPAARFFR